MTVSGNDGNNNLFGQVRSKLNRLKWVDQTVMRATQEPDVESAEKKKQRRKCFRWTAVPCCWSLTSDNAVSAESDAETGNWCLKLFKPSKRNGLNRENRNISEPEDKYSNSVKAVGLSNPENGFSGFSAFLPSIHSSQTDISYNRSNRANVQNKFGEVDENRLQDTMSELSGLLANSKSLAKSATKDSFTMRNQPADENEISNDLPEKDAESESFPDGKFQNKMPDRRHIKGGESLPMTIASAPAVISTEQRGHTPSTSSSNSAEFGTLSGSELRLGKHANETSTVDFSGRLPYRSYTTCNVKQKSKNVIISKNANKVGISGTPFPETLKPFERPKEGLDTCFNQLESQQWEVNMLGLTSLVRLLRHHPAIVLSQLHPIIVALGRQIKNLRSQVARVACQASAEMFLILKRNVEPDLDELSGPLFHRSADTNRFIRADCNDALDNMVNSVGHAKAVSIIISKGTTHQNATVRAVAARLLLRLSERVGPEKMLSLPKEIRDKMLQAGASLLTEGKLETRAFAKQVFRIWSSHPTFSNLISEAISPNVMRQINKTLSALKG
ncbi:hypothetical protein RUM43_011568 [Polyplax serrata]|uniref:TOG domain-containing protein n=1 Tax=Polyplax serrata TaxID=468196 RepID=A0AAN8PFB8_POLSC